MDAFTLYVHIPFCKSKCKYCDFYSACPKEIPEDEYFNALILDLKNQLKKDIWKGRKIKSIYFGGGTPSLISAKSYKGFLSEVFSLFDVEDDAEITLEGNPNSLTLENLSSFKDIKINRLSIGAESFSDNTLEFLGREHKKEDIEKSFLAGRKAGFDNISLDLIYGVPDVSISDVENDIENIISLNPEHISIYALTIEEKTIFGQMQKHGKLKECDEDEVINQNKLIASLLKEKNFNRYEISNFSKKGFESKHNLAYWNSCDYLGLGAAAFSAYTVFENNIAKKIIRYSNKKSFVEYIKGCESSENVVDFSECVDGNLLMSEYVMLALRKRDGVNTSKFLDRFSVSFFKQYEATLNDAIKNGFLIKDNDNIFINEKHLMISDFIIESCFF